MDDDRPGAAGRRPAPTRPSGRTDRSRPAPRPRADRSTGRPPAKVLVVRWVVVLALLAAVVTGVVLGVAALLRTVGGSDEEPAPPAAEATEPEPGAEGPADCTADDLRVALAADAPTYAVGSTADFSVTLVHVGEAPCTVDAGPAGRELVVTSGSDRVWASSDCTPPESRMLLLSPGGEDVSSVAWATDRSAPECPADLPVPGAGTYQAVVTVGDVTSEPVVLQVTVG
ncbi:hypothetical protein [Sanguibacter suaedae]|uniref:DUF4232 domain-containing protein n=1 Tax=Sanguibacter suaedae TaxID=2795737 RepID=A0A934M664_9MICO|nr:hypothetical protein [Sanguibacter suaedae]MBI9113907.1 hypothetical protein [Sanguibacter suaedae]